MTEQDVINMMSKLENWVTQKELCKLYPHFKPAQIKILFWKRESHEGLCELSRVVGRRMYINAPLFGLWIGGKFPLKGDDK